MRFSCFHKKQLINPLFKQIVSLRLGSLFQEAFVKKMNRHTDNYTYKLTQLNKNIYECDCKNKGAANDCN